MPRSTLHLGDSGQEVADIQRILLDEGYSKSPSGDVWISRVNGIFEEGTEDAVTYFQMTHIGPDGKFLTPVGFVGPKTWWALENPSGSAQKSGMLFVDVPAAQLGLTGIRARLLTRAFVEYRKNVREIPDGSNRSEAIDKYFGPTGVIGAAWCCAFVTFIHNEVLGNPPLGGVWHLGVQNMYRAAAALGLEINSPRPGDVFIQIKARGTGHTGIVAGVSQDGRTIYTIEGNAGNRLKAGMRDISNINHFINLLPDQQDYLFRRGPLAPVEGSSAGISDR